ncbi:uncharacterized protein LOC131236018 [Magnolia sinica]|uniref:uncharacterized protein LOC131236018 n=1 Tax=Magnolia sinica TaxID=86752 RepID=UPI002659F7CF|nr:uncharacterized protein LOC131236018 [Magnolia sinica]
MDAQNSISRINWWATQTIQNFQEQVSSSYSNRVFPTFPALRHNRTASVLVKWSHPTLGLMKLNVDGSAKGNPGFSGGGGICRKEDGSFIFAFSAGYGYGTNNSAELRAIYDGLELCLLKGINRIMVELDSKLVIAILVGESRCPWHWKPWLDRINNLRLSGTFTFHHILYEGNGPADSLVKVGSETQVKKCHDHFTSLPRQTKGLVFLDKVGLGSI